MTFQSAADASAEGDEAEECNDEDNGDGVEQDEEEVDIDAIIASTLADQQIGRGVRRSTRLHRSVEAAVDQQIARAMQNVKYRGL